MLQTTARFHLQCAAQSDALAGMGLELHHTAPASAMPEPPKGPKHDKPIWPVGFWNTQMCRANNGRERLLPLADMGPSES